MHELGQACIDLVKSGGSCQAAPRDTFCQRDLAESARHVGEKVCLAIFTCWNISLVHPGSYWTFYYENCSLNRKKLP